jgi:hypothetical protein
MVARRNSMMDIALANDAYLPWKDEYGSPRNPLRVGAFGREKSFRGVVQIVLQRRLRFASG